MEYKKISLTRFTKSDATISDLGNTRTATSYHTGPATNPIKKKWPWNSLTSMKHFALCISVDHSQIRGVRSELGSFSFWGFNNEGQLNDCNFHTKRQNEVEKFFLESMNEITRHLGRKSLTSVNSDDICKRKCDHFTDQVLTHLLHMCHSKI